MEFRKLAKISMSKANIEMTFGGFITPENQRYLDSHAFEFSSLRAALVYFLNFSNVKNLYLPVYYCHDVTDFLIKHGIQLKFYNIDKNFKPLKVSLTDREKILYPDYFGVNQRAVEKVISTFGSKNVIIDCAQSFWAEYTFTAILKSYRKFFPVPDGSSILTNLQLKLGSIEQNNSVKLDHLLDPVKKSAYEHFLKAEEEFSKLKIKKISKVTRVLMSNLDLKQKSEKLG